MDKIGLEQKDESLPDERQMDLLVWIDQKMKEKEASISLIEQHKQTRKMVKVSGKTGRKS